MDKLTCPFCEEPIQATDSVCYRAETKELLHLRCEMRTREMTREKGGEHRDDCPIG